ncbi:hypothetical protein M404DRAFT_994140 [Pisolithus tinctorius Marx 270]|uniref:Uncharacterized protein n=1 Tax=Pisolithus tinctorius Marx 270 TaxID=870435 RepID=A0A0C3PSM8_PISTI|nr:hypothetical protein M404DRAFT_994140 [Pisolithus tinctorius Marx 270]
MARCECLRSESLRLNGRMLAAAGIESVLLSLHLRSPDKCATTNFDVAGVDHRYKWA